MSLNTPRYPHIAAPSSGRLNWKNYPLKDNRPVHPAVMTPELMGAANRIYQRGKTVGFPAVGIHPHTAQLAKACVNTVRGGVPDVV